MRCDYRHVRSPWRETTGYDDINTSSPTATTRRTSGVNLKSRIFCFFSGPTHRYKSQHALLCSLCGRGCGGDGAVCGRLPGLAGTANPHRWVRCGEDWCFHVMAYPLLVASSVSPRLMLKALSPVSAMSPLIQPPCAQTCRHAAGPGL